jgi:hypothetical protein
MKQSAVSKLAVLAALAAALPLAGSGSAQARVGVQAPAVVLWDQTADPSGYYSSDNYSNSAYDNFDNQAADDFNVPVGEYWTIQTVTARGIYDQSGSIVADSVLVEFYGASNNPVPGNLLRSEEIPGGSVGGLDTGEFVINLGSPLVLSAGRYWFSVQANIAWNSPAFRQWVWRESSDPQVVDESVWRQPGDGYGSGCRQWAARVTVCNRPAGSENFDLSFVLEGEITSLAHSRFLPAIYR